MVFSSTLFLFGFLPLFFAVYFLVPYKLKNLWALIGSTFFYAWGGPVFVFVLFASLTTDFFIAQQFGKRSGRAWLTVGLILNIGLLAYFKYANFFVENFTLLLEGLGMSGPHWTKVALPIGISFFTFQKISYLIDVYRGEKEAQRNWVDYALFVVLFPQLIAGPIVRYKEIAGQIKDRKANLNGEERLLGIFRFTIGLAKKVLIANTMGELADSYYNDTLDPSMGGSWIALLAYTFQIYFDFSGYSDMAIGLGRMMGFRFPENFNFPYLSRNITEFWRRWHMTLSSWMRDYLYIPLGGNRKGLSRTYINLWLVFLISGLWHGDNWNFVIWGAYHGLWLVLERAFLIRWTLRLPVAVQTLFTFFLAMIGWLFFRIEDWSTFQIYSNAMLSGEWAWPTLSTLDQITFGVALFFSTWPVTDRLKELERTIYTKLTVPKAVAITLVSVVLLWLSAAFVMGSDFNPFIYFRF